MNNFWSSLLSHLSGWFLLSVPLLLRLFLAVAWLGQWLRCRCHCPHNPCDCIRSASWRAIHKCWASLPGDVFIIWSIWAECSVLLVRLEEDGRQTNSNLFNYMPRESFSHVFGKLFRRHFLGASRYLKESRVKSEAAKCIKKVLTVDLIKITKFDQTIDA